jgi:hypothetical protein
MEVRALTLEEAIKHCEEVAEKNDKIADAYKNGLGVDVDCRECASEHRQLAEWLRELKSYKDARVGCEYCKHKYREQHERPCSLCQRNFLDMFEFEKEVDADE